MTEPPKKLRKSRKYDLNIWEKVKEVTVPVKIEEAMQIPTFRQQIKIRMSSIYPKFEIMEINAVDEEEEDQVTKSSAYSQYTIEGYITPCIIDTRTGGCMISKVFLDKI